MISSDDVFAQFLDALPLVAAEVRSSALADYAALRTANDAIRQAHLERLFALLREAAGHAAKKGVPVSVERASGHRFKLGQMSLAGDIIKFRLGLRCFSAEAGWTRVPSDGFMRGNALAAARLSHFGFARETEELHLLKFESEPRWFRVGKDDRRISFETDDVVRHFRILLGI